MSKRKTRGLCYLDIKDLLKFDSSLHYFSVCPACKVLVSEHKDEDFQRDQLAKIFAEGDEDMIANEAGSESMNVDDSAPHPKKAKMALSTIERATLVQQVSMPHKWK